VSTKEVLIAARKLIENPDRRTSGAWARNATGEPIDPQAPDACQFCSTGAVRRAARNIGEQHWVTNSCHMLDVAATEMKSQTFRPGQHRAFNDREDHAAVLAMFDRAIENSSREHRPGLITRLLSRLFNGPASSSAG
jgi:hypothetical protein